MKFVIALVLGLTFSVPHASAHPAGAGTSACTSGTPGGGNVNHGTEGSFAQEFELQFSPSLQNSNFVPGNQYEGKLIMFPRYS